MPSRLSSLLVRDGLVGVKRMENAFQRQVIYGGCLDTILLEMSVLPEERLLQYLSLATGLPPATRSELDALDPAVATKCPVDAARMFRVVPLCFEEGALRVLVHDPVDMGLLEELANEVEFPVQPLVVPEYRFHLSFARMFGGMANARFVALAKRADESTPSSPVGKAKTVIVTEAEAATAGPTPTAGLAEPQPAAEPEAAESLPKWLAVAQTEPLPQTEGTRQPSSQAEVEERAGRRSPPRETILGVGLPGAESFIPARARELWETSQSGPIELPPKKSITEPMGSRNAPSGEDQIVGAPDYSPAAYETTEPAQAAEVSEPVETAGESKVDAAAEYAPRISNPLLSTRPVGGDLSSVPLEPLRASVELEEAGERDLIFGLLLRAVRYHTGYAGLLTVQGGAAIGRVAITGDKIDREHIAEVLIPLDTASAFQAVVHSAAPHIGPILTGDPEIDVMLERMGQTTSQSSLLLPVVLRDRVVAIVVGHNRDEPVDVGAVAELFPLASAAASAISRLIIKSKGGSGKERPEVAGAAEGTGAPGYGPSLVPEPVTPEPLPPTPGAGDDDLAPEISVSLVAGEPEPITAVIDLIEGDDKELAAHARAEALRRVAETLDAVAERFPGRLDVDRYEVGGRPIPAAQHGPLLALLVEIGEAAAELLMAKMRDGRREIRYYATLCMVDIRPRSALTVLVERLFDNDYGTRTAAIQALSGYASEELESALLRARQALHSDDPERVQAAATALASIGDVRAIPDLLDTAARNDRSAEHARRALSLLTKQNFGSSMRKWRSWWAKHEREHRIEWMVESLAHKDENLRRSAAEDLRRLTGEYFDYQYDAPKREREQARQRWVDWWKETGRRRFGR